MRHTEPHYAQYLLCWSVAPSRGTIFFLEQVEYLLETVGCNLTVPVISLIVIPTCLSIAPGLFMLLLFFHLKDSSAQSAQRTCALMLLYIFGAIFSMLWRAWENSEWIGFQSDFCRNRITFLSPIESDFFGVYWWAKWLKFYFNKFDLIHKFDLIRFQIIKLHYNKLLC